MILVVSLAKVLSSLNSHFTGREECKGCSLCGCCSLGSPNLIRLHSSFLVLAMHSKGVGAAQGPAIRVPGRMGQAVTFYTTVYLNT